MLFQFPISTIVHRHNDRYCVTITDKLLCDVLEYFVIQTHRFIVIIYTIVGLYIINETSRYLSDNNTSYNPLSSTGVTPLVNLYIIHTDLILLLWLRRLLCKYFEHPKEGVQTQ